ncbi:uncharacterized protein [Amphiura filiformis]|uniref:uncharacterized protein n=1 Tax=Amphiura filiformis TaxID=82378 RepID=UPI003B20C589
MRGQDNTEFEWDNSDIYDYTGTYTSGTFTSDASSYTSDEMYLTDDERRMDHLLGVIRHSPYIDERIRSRMPELEAVHPINRHPQEVVLETEFIRPYIATGEEASTVTSYSDEESSSFQSDPAYVHIPSNEFRLPRPMLINFQEEIEYRRRRNETRRQRQSQYQVEETQEETDDAEEVVPVSSRPYIFDYEYFW